MGGGEKEREIVFVSESVCVREKLEIERQREKRLWVE